MQNIIQNPKLSKKLMFAAALMFVVIIILGGVLILSSQTKEISLDKAVKPEEVKDQVKEKVKEKVKDQTQDKENKDSNTKQEFNNDFLDTNSKPLKASPEDQEKARLELLVSNFVEDFGSYSSQSGYKHIQLLYNNTTTNMKDFMENWVAQDPAEQRSPSFYSIETSVSFIQFKSFSQNSAKLVLDVVRVETDAPEHYDKRFTQIAEVAVVKIGSEWKIDNLYWR